MRAIFASERLAFRNVAKDEKQSDENRLISVIDKVNFRFTLYLVTHVTQNCHSELFLLPNGVWTESLRWKTEILHSVQNDVRNMSW